MVKSLGHIPISYPVSFKEETARSAGELRMKLLDAIANKDSERLIGLMNAAHLSADVGIGDINEQEVGYLASHSGVLLTSKIVRTTECDTWLLSIRKLDSVVTRY